MAEIVKIISFDMDQNCYLVYDNESKEGFLIDPGADTFKILKTIEEKNVNVTAILLTHCHYDHVFSVNELRSGRKLVASNECSENIRNTKRSLSFVTGDEFVIEEPEIIMSDGEERCISGINVKMIKTPGHTECSVCYLIDGVLFSGDTLFLRNVGRWDLPTGNEELLRKSIKEKLYTLPDETVVMCGHGSDTTIGYEKKFNFFVN